MPTPTHSKASSVAERVGSLERDRGLLAVAAASVVIFDMVGTLT
jgi:hypothetical protein